MDVERRTPVLPRLSESVLDRRRVPVPRPTPGAAGARIPIREVPYAAAKRALDIGVALIALALLFPVFLLRLRILHQGHQYQS